VGNPDSGDCRESCSANGESCFVSEGRYCCVGLRCLGRGSPPVFECEPY
jgi:hypothetical protein